METTPKSLRLHLALFGRTNVGKSSFLNLITGQDVAIVSSVPGTTTDVVEKVMELVPIGPVMFLDTAGLDDISDLGSQRFQKTAQVFERADIIILVCEGGRLGAYEQWVQQQADDRGLPVIRIANKSDLYPCPPKGFIPCVSRNPNSRGYVLGLLKERLIQCCPDSFLEPEPLVGDLIPQAGLVVLIVPLDIQAPKGRLIVPQVMTLRDILDHKAASLVVTENQYSAQLQCLGRLPDLVVCDSQVVQLMVDETPPSVPCTTFSILMARMKGDICRLAYGAGAISRLRDGDRVLMAESCSHHPTENDIGRVKIPYLLQQFCHCDLQVDVFAGRDFPDNLSQYQLVVQCGGCMHNRRTMLSRIERCEQAGVAITNYGMCISRIQGVLERVLQPFPDALQAFAEGAQ